MRRLLGLAFVVALASPAAAEEWSCPGSLLTVDQPAAPEGYTPQPAESTHGFRYVSFFDGPPANEIELAPSEDRNEGRTLQVWAFEPGRQQPITAICRYQDTNATISIDLAPAITSCTAVWASEEATAPSLACK